MTERQFALLRYHSDLAAFATSPATPVFVVLDLEDPDGFELASQFTTNVADRRDAIRANGDIPAFTLALSISDANKLIAHGWPKLKRITPPPPQYVAVLLFSCSTCLSVLLPRQ
jgi:hypothetical protein